MNHIHTEKAAPPLGHYTQAIQHGDIIYTSGQLGIHPDTPTELVNGIENQTQQALNNLDAILKAANSSKEKVIKVTLFISDIKLWPKVNEVYAQYFGNHKPARSAIPAPALPMNALVEIEAIATVS